MPSRCGTAAVFDQAVTVERLPIVEVHPGVDVCLFVFVQVENLGNRHQMLWRNAADSHAVAGDWQMAGVVLVTEFEGRIRGSTDVSVCRKE